MLIWMYLTKCVGRGKALRLTPFLYQPPESIRAWNAYRASCAQGIDANVREKVSQKKYTKILPVGHE